jgi:uncharacterized protein (DUF58 family)
MLSSDDVMALAPLELRAKTIANAVMAGAHRSKRFGSSSSFAEHRVYTKGDDVRRLDWKAIARVDKLFIRRFEDEVRIDVAVVVDASGSMKYGEMHNKWRCAQTVAAALAVVALHKTDTPTVSIFADGERAHAGGRRAQAGIAPLLSALSSQAPSGKTRLLPALDAVAKRMTSRGVVVVLSDLVSVTDADIARLRGITARGNTVVVGHVLHGDERTFPFDGVMLFEDLEDMRSIQLDAPLVRDAYLQELQRFIDESKRKIVAAGGVYVPVTTSDHVVVTTSMLLDAIAGGHL